MSTTAPTRPRSSRRTPRNWIALAVVLGALTFAVLVAISAAPAGEVAAGTPTPDPTLPNPMGGPAVAAPGEATGRATVGGLEIEDAEVAMGDVALEATYVPTWEVTNPTDGAIQMVIAMPQVIEGCCPGPVYADGHLTQAGQQVTVPAGGAVTVQFPLQMHAGMDGPHHLAIPLVVGLENTALHVTGDFSPRVPRIIG